MDELTNKDWRVISKAIEKTPKRKRILVMGTIRGRKIFAPDGMNWVSMRTGLKYKKDPPCIKCGKYPTWPIPNFVPNSIYLRTMWNMWIRKDR